MRVAKTFTIRTIENSTGARGDRVNKGEKWTTPHSYECWNGENIGKKRGWNIKLNASLQLFVSGMKENEREFTHTHGYTVVRIYTHWACLRVAQCFYGIDKRISFGLCSRRNQIKYRIIRWLMQNKLVNFPHTLAPCLLPIVGKKKSENTRMYRNQIVDRFACHSLWLFLIVSLIRFFVPSILHSIILCKSICFVHNHIFKLVSNDVGNLKVLFLLLWIRMRMGIGKFFMLCGVVMCLC